MRESIKKGFGLMIGAFLADFVWFVGCRTFTKMTQKDTSVTKDQ
jgi:hypothetical protein